MPHIALELTPEKLQELVFQLPPREFLALAERIQDRAETLILPRMAETGFRDWDHEAEDIYDP